MGNVSVQLKGFTDLVACLEELVGAADVDLDAPFAAGGEEGLK